MDGNGNKSGERRRKRESFEELVDECLGNFRDGGRRVIVRKTRMQGWKTLPWSGAYKVLKAKERENIDAYQEPRLFAGNALL